MNVLTSLNNLKTKIDDLDAGKLNIVSVDLIKISDVVDKLVVKNIKFNTSISDATTLIHINQYNINKQILERKKLKMLIKNTKFSGLATTISLNTRIGEVENKIDVVKNLSNTSKIGKLENNIPDVSGLVQKNWL